VDEGPTRDFHSDREQVHVCPGYRRLLWYLHRDLSRWGGCGFTTSRDLSRWGGCGFTTSRDIQKRLHSKAAAEPLESHELAWYLHHVTIRSEGLPIVPIGVAEGRGLAFG
jgi:hypothetical protein